MLIRCPGCSTAEVSAAVEREGLTSCTSATLTEKEMAMEARESPS